jgi:hypothetical protein
MWIGSPRNSPTTPTTEVEIRTKFTFLEPMTPSNYLQALSQEEQSPMDDDQESASELEPLFPTSAILMFYLEKDGHRISPTSKSMSNSEEYVAWKAAHGKDIPVGPQEYWDIISYHEHAHPRRAMTL